MTFQPKHILVPVAVAPGDDISIAERLVDDACDLVRGAGPEGQLSLVFVNSHKATVVGADTGFAPPSYYEAMAELWEANRTAGMDALTKLRKRAEDKGVRVSSLVLEPLEGTGEAIAHAAEERRADLIALASHGRRGLKRLFLGSVAERVAHVASVPVLILRT